ncbi:MAG: hypothetical protein LBU22_12715 [Dysgonamonadaceae bacterium]|jgi:hypothetical protein|nr:hypothetical protein [Dysgonamonadaceae bacterium]
MSMITNEQTPFYPTHSSEILREKVEQHPYLLENTGIIPPEGYMTTAEFNKRATKMIRKKFGK